MLKKLMFFVGWVLLSNSSHAGEVRVGSVMNFIPAAEEIVRLFEKKTTHTVKLVFKTSGKLASLAKETQDFDIVLLGDLSMAKSLESEGLVAKDSRFTYAIGKLALWSKNPNLVDTKGEILHTAKFEHIVIPNFTDTAYGIAAHSVVEEMKVWSTLETKAIFAQNAVDARDMIAAEKVELGFTALSLLNPSKKIEGSIWIVPQKFYLPIEQQAVLLKFAENNLAARAFLEFMKSPQVRNIIEKYGYSVPVRTP
ncbi:MAG: molybdate ABC transporter substrate-binding protein [Thiotrichaceae bacterium]|nr:molybdate ABC transporter substrate-binding protein [Thiotrichaceae bacterium]